MKRQKTGLSQNGPGKRQGTYFLDNVEFINARIEENIGYENYFDKAFISFVLHGFENDDKEKIVSNVYKALKHGGEFFILDYAHTDMEKVVGIFKFFLNKIECPLAYEFVILDQESFFRNLGFSDFSYNYYFYKKVNLLKISKKRFYHHHI